MDTLMSCTRPYCLAVLFGLAFLLTPVRAQQQPSPAGEKTEPRAAKRALVQPEAEQQPSLSGKTYALLIGISRYREDPPVTSLEFADKDAETFAALLRTPIAGQLESQDQIRLLTNENATRAAIDDAVRELAGVHGTAENSLIIFVAAHGVYLKTEEDPDTHKVIQRDPYVLTFESNPQDAKTTGYPMDDFRRMVAEQALHFGRVLVFLDVCHAGNVAGIGGGNELEPTVRKVWQGGAGEFALMLASHAKKFALESANFGGGHGAFSYFLISGLNGAAAPPGETSITFSNLAVYVVKNVSEFTRNQQTPGYIATDDDMVLVYDTRKQNLELPPARPLSEQEVRSLRSRDSQAERAPQRPAESQLDAFESAIRDGRLLPEDSNNASDLMAALRRDPNQTPASIRERERLLRVALEDRGQEVLSRYLEGEEIPQIQADFDRCGRLFEEAFRLRPDAPFDRSRALFCQGRARIFAGRFDDAQRLLESSIQLDAQRAYAYNALGIAHLEQIAHTGQGFDAAANAFRTASRYAPYWAYPLHNLALVDLERGDYDGAIRLYAYAMAIAPRYSYLPYNLGLLYSRLGDLDNASRWFRNALQVLEANGLAHGGAWPERARIRNALGTVARSQGRDSRALELFQSALADDPADQNARHNLALLLAKRRMFAKADDLWRANILAAPDFLPSRIAYADSLAQRGEAGAAIVEYERIVADKPEYVGAREALARLYLNQGQPALALGHLNNALDQSPANVTLLELCGDAQARLGNNAAARTDWSKALDSASDRTVKSRLERKLRELP
jgi:tetratricopeptide (TPR) repeat protein